MRIQTTAGTFIEFDRVAVGKLESDLRGELIRPDTDGYDEARRIWNGMIDRRPALMARCAGVADVIRAIKFARQRDLLVAVRGGGHNVAGTAMCDGGIVIDLSTMKGLRIDPVARTARAEPGLLWGEFDHDTQMFGLAAPGGIVSHTGIAGLTLGGGFGWLTRKYGLTCDNLISADVVDADGQWLRTSRDENSDLFWGLCGGGGNFGIVTSFQFRLHPVGPMVLAGLLIYSADDAHDVLRYYRDWIKSAPDDLTTILILRRAPEAPYLPSDLHGRDVVIIGVCYAGSIDSGRTLLAPLRSFGNPLVDLIRPTPYTAHQGLLDAGVPHGLHYYWKSDYLKELNDVVINTVVEHAFPLPTPRSYTIIFQLGGAVNRIQGDDSAFEDRSAGHAININGVWSPSAVGEPSMQWTQDFWQAIHPLSTGGTYINFLGDEGEDRIRSAYGSEKYMRLVDLKNKYDPTNFFRLNQNIRPFGHVRG